MKYEYLRVPISTPLLIDRLSLPLGETLSFFCFLKRLARAQLRQFIPSPPSQSSFWRKATSKGKRKLAKEWRRGEERRERLDVLRIRAVSAGSPNGGINSP